MFSTKRSHSSPNHALLDRFLDVYFGSKGEVEHHVIRLDSLSSDLRLLGLRHTSKQDLKHLRHLFKSVGAKQLSFQQLIARLRESHLADRRGFQLNRIQLRNAPVKHPTARRAKRDRSPVKQFQAQLYHKTNLRLQEHQAEPANESRRQEVARGVVDELLKFARLLLQDDADEALFKLFGMLDTARAGALTREAFFSGLCANNLMVSPMEANVTFSVLAQNKGTNVRLKAHQFVNQLRAHISSSQVVPRPEPQQTGFAAPQGARTSKIIAVIIRQLDESASILDVFRFFDQNMDGKVCTEDVKQGVTALAEKAGISSTRAILDKVYALMGLNEHEYLSYNNFRSGFEKLCDFIETSSAEVAEQPAVRDQGKSEIEQDESYDVLLRIARNLRECMDHKIARFHDVFNFLDTDNLGKLSKKALGKGLHLMNIPVSRLELSQLFNVLDVDRCGYISYSNLEAALQVVEKQRQQLKLSGAQDILPLNPTKPHDKDSYVHEAPLKPSRPDSKSSFSGFLQTQVNESNQPPSSECCCSHEAPTPIQLAPRERPPLEFLVNSSVYLVDPSLFASAPRSVFARLLNDEFRGVCASSIQNIFVDTSEDFFEAAINALSSDNDALIKSADSKLLHWARAMGFDVFENKRPSRRSIESKSDSHVEKKLSFNIGINDKAIEVQLRSYETLLLERVHGSGKIMVNVYDEKGRPVVLSATVFDSCAYFHCVTSSTVNGHPRLHTLDKNNEASSRSRTFPGGYRYEFFAIPTVALSTVYYKGSFETTSQAKVPVKLQLDFKIQIAIDR